MDKWEIDTPALLLDLEILEKNISEMARYFDLDLEILEKNISEMARYFDSTPASLRPHIKNHMSPLIAHKQMEAGALGVCCQTIREAEVMAYAGIKDILIANEVVGSSKIERLMNLNQFSHVMVAVDNPRIVDDLSEAAKRRGLTLDVLIDLLEYWV
jgi:D-serine deaminase-like pyridoxal phosphate-dependent protein